MQATTLVCSTLLLFSVFTLSVALPSSGEESAEKAPPRAAEKSEESGPSPELEKEFRDTLSHAVLAGRWRLVTDGKLGDEREERYTLGAVSKVAGDLWLIQARFTYGDREVNLPVPVKVKWAGDTPMISMTDVGLPGVGTYTARVLFYRDHYTGVWFGPGVGGFLSGRVLKGEAATPAADFDGPSPREKP